MIKKKYLIAFMLLFCVVTISSYITYRIKYDLYMEEVKSQLQDMSDTASHQYDSIFLEIYNQVDNTVEALENETMNQEDMAELLKNMSGNSYYIRDIAVMTRSGRFIGQSITREHIKKEEIMKRLSSRQDNAEAELLKSIAEDNNIYYSLHQIQLKSGERSLLLVGMDYNIINKVAHPEEYKIYDASLCLLHRNGYILYDKDEKLIGKNLYDDEEYIREYMDMSPSDYNKITRAVGDTQHIKDQYYIDYEMAGTERIAYYKYLKALQGVTLLCIDFNKVMTTQIKDILMTVVPLFISLAIAVCILLRYLFLVKYTDYMTEVKNEYAFRKHIKKLSSSHCQEESYLIIKIEDVSNERYGKFLYDDRIFYHISKYFRGLAPLYNDLYRISRLHYMFVIKDKEDRQSLRKLIHKVNDDIQASGGTPLYIRGRKYLFTIDNLDKLMDDEVDSVVLNQMDVNSSNLDHIDDLTFVNYSDVLATLNQRLLEKSYLENAILDQQLIMEYQPIVDLQTEEVHSYEVLAHLDDSNTPISRDQLMYVAEQANMMDKIDRIIIMRAFHQYHKMLQISNLVLKLNINLSGKSVNEGMYQYILKMANRYRVTPQHIVFELSETAALKELEVSAQTLSKLRNKGFKLAIDGFGTGYSNMELLAKLDVDFIKIDGTFMSNVEKDEQKLKTLNALVYISNNYNTKIIANYVENERVIFILNRLGIAYGQGEYFGERNLI